MKREEKLSKIEELKPKLGQSLTNEIDEVFEYYNVVRGLGSAAAGILGGIVGAMRGDGMYPYVIGFASFTFSTLALSLYSTMNAASELRALRRKYYEKISLINEYAKVRRNFRI